MSETKKSRPTDTLVEKHGRGVGGAEKKRAVNNVPVQTKKETKPHGTICFLKGPCFFLNVYFQGSRGS